MTQAVVQIRNTVERSGFANPLTLEVVVTSAAYLKVYADDELLVNGDDYEITGLGDPEGVEIEIIGAEDVDNYVGTVYFTAVFEPPLDQQADLSAGGQLGRAFELALDQQNRRLQALATKVERAPLMPIYTAGQQELPVLAGHYLGFGEDGELIATLGFENAPYAVSSLDLDYIVQLTQAEYNALSPRDARTLYLIID